MNAPIATTVERRMQERWAREDAQGFADRERNDAEIEDYWRTVAKMMPKKR